MNEAQKIKKQLERYAPTPVELPVRQGPRGISEGSDIWSTQPDPDWKPEPRYVQSEPNYSNNFKIGDWYEDPRGEKISGPNRRQALPHPNYEGQVGDLITDEMESAYWKKWNLWLHASMSLERCIRLHLSIKHFPEGSNCRPDKEETKEMFAQEWAWLKGLWNATPGMSEPTEAQLNNWAEELRVKYDAHRKKLAAR